MAKQMQLTASETSDTKKQPQAAATQACAADGVGIGSAAGTGAGTGTGAEADDDNLGTPLSGGGEKGKKPESQDIEIVVGVTRLATERDDVIRTVSENMSRSLGEYQLSTSL